MLCKGKRVNIGELMNAFGIPQSLKQKYKNAIEATQKKPKNRDQVAKKHLAAMLGNSVAYPLAKALMSQCIAVLA